MRKLTEEQLSNIEVKAIFKGATALRSTPTGMGKYFKALRKDTVDIDDLQQAWKDDAYPDDTRDISAILKGHGFSNKEINKVYNQVFGSEDDVDVPGAHESIIKIADFAKKNGIEQDLIRFMQKEFGFKESYNYPDKAVVEDVRRIFTEIVKEERFGRIELMKTIEQTQIGRKKK